MGAGVALAACALVGTAVALGAGTTTSSTATTTTTARPSVPRSGETPLNGDAATKAKAAAVAKVGGTAESATTENDSSDANAAYEVHVTKADGSHVTVILDKSYAVLSVETGHVFGHGGFVHDGHGGGSGETPLTGDAATNAKAAAVAKVGGTAESATTENDSGDANAAYEVHVTKADGSHVTVILDKSYAVLSVESRPQR
jgi:uncharacterized membrane protein YkoI